MGGICEGWPGVPVARKCCFCAPVRTGVIIFGYVNLVLSLLLLPLLVFLVAERVRRGEGAGLRLPLAVGLVILDATMTVVLLVGAHKRRRLLLVVYVWFALGFQLTTLALDVAVFHAPPLSHLVPEDALYLLFLGLNIYLVYLVWSEARRLAKTSRPQLSSPPIA